MPSTIESLQDLASRIEISDLKIKLATEQLNGFSCYINDLAGEEHNFKGKDWKLDNGTLYVGLGSYDPGEISKFLDRKLGGYPWWNTEEKCDSENTQNSMHSYPGNVQPAYSGFKVLGQRGANIAVDVIAFVQDEQGIKVVVIQRKDGSYAVPGGFAEEGAKDRAFRVFMTERYSNNLFAEGSESLKLVSQSFEHKELELNVKEVLKMEKFEKLLSLEENLAQRISSELVNIKQIFLTLPRDSVGKEEEISQEEHEIITQEELTDLAIQFKWDLYKKCFPEKYATFYAAVMGEAYAMEKFNLYGDPRTTDGPNGAHTVTQPYTVVMHTDNLLKLEEAACVTPSVGEDSQTKSILPLEELFSQYVSYSITTLILKALTNRVENGLELPESQVKKIEEILNSKCNKANVLERMNNILVRLSNYRSPSEASNVIKDLIKQLRTAIQDALEHKNGQVEQQIADAESTLNFVNNTFIHILYGHVTSMQNSMENANLGITDQAMNQPMLPAKRQPSPKVSAFCCGSFLSMFSFKSSAKASSNSLPNEQEEAQSKPSYCCRW